MHVFCPECNAEYKVNERSSLTKTVKFVCVQCGSSWIDKFEKIEQVKRVETAPLETNKEQDTDNEVEELGQIELNSLALEEVQNSFGINENRVGSKSSNADNEHIFQFETNEESKEIEKDGPTKTFPKIRSNKQDTTDNDIGERDAKEIEIEKRLKESSELLRKAKQPNVDKNENIKKEKKPKSQKYLITLSILLVVYFFTYSLSILFLEDLLSVVPFAPDMLSEVGRFSDILKDIFSKIIESIISFIPNLA